MEDVISFLYQIFATLLFCIALAFLLTASSVEGEAVNQLKDRSVETVWYERK